VTAQSPQPQEMMPRGTGVDITVTRRGGEILTRPAPRVNRPIDRVQQPVIVK